MFVVYGCEHLRDGNEEFARIVSTKEEALAVINKPRFAGDNYTWRLFHLGAEIRLKPVKVPEKKVEIVSEHTEFRLDEPKTDKPKMPEGLMS